MLFPLACEEATGLRLDDGNHVYGFHKVLVGDLFIRAERPHIRLLPKHFDLGLQF